MPIIVAVIATITLSAPFGDASAGAVSLEGGMTIEVTVQVDRSFDVVLARPFSSFEELPPTVLSDLGNGAWGGFVELPTAENWSLVFEGFESDGTVSRSDTADLLALGVDRVLISAVPVAPTRGGGLSRSSLWLAAAVVLILGSLAALAWWTFAGGEGADESG